MNNNGYRVGFYQDGVYEVLKDYEETCDHDGYSRQVFKGSLSDCEAWLRLHKEGYI